VYTTERSYLGGEIGDEPVGFGLGDEVRDLGPVLAHDHLERGLMFGDHGPQYAVLADDLLQLSALRAYRVDQLLVRQTAFFHVVQLGQVVRVLATRGERGVKETGRDQKNPTNQLLY